MIGTDSGPTNTGEWIACLMGKSDVCPDGQSLGPIGFIIIAVLVAIWIKTRLD